MSRAAVERVPIADWLMGLLVLACGVAAIVVAWRYADSLSGAKYVANDDPDEGGGNGRWDPPLALPPGPALRIVPPDAIDEELWALIEAERSRPAEPGTAEPLRRIAAKADPPATADAGPTLPVPVGTATPAMAPSRNFVEVPNREENHDPSKETD